MKKLENRNSIEFKAEEQAFYSDQQIYNSRMDNYKKDMYNECLSKEERDFAKQKYEEIYTEKRNAIDRWKEEHGQYDEERVKERIGDKKVKENNEIEEDEEEDYSM